jgi:hypothetical protein
MCPVVSTWLGNAQFFHGKIQRFVSPSLRSIRRGPADIAGHLQSGSAWDLGEISPKPTIMRILRYHPDKGIQWYPIMDIGIPWYTLSSTINNISLDIQLRHGNYGHCPLVLCVELDIPFIKAFWWHEVLNHGSFPILSGGLSRIHIDIRKGDVARLSFPLISCFSGRVLVRWTNHYKNIQGNQT